MTNYISIADKVFNCTECKLKKGQQKVFYDTTENKEELRVMFLFESPGGEVDDKEKLDKLNKLSPNGKTLHHRNTFESWPSLYYLYFRELCKNLYNKGYIKNYPKRLGTDIMKEIYVTDAVKCRGDKDEIRDYKNLKKHNCTQICSTNILKHELNSLPNLELIISFGNWADEALNSLVKIDKEVVIVGPAIRMKHNQHFDLNYFNQHCRNGIVNHGKMYDYIYRYPNGTQRTIKNIHLYHPTWFYAKGCLAKKGKASIREKLIIESLEWCFNNIKT